MICGLTTEEGSQGRSSYRIGQSLSASCAQNELFRNRGLSYETPCGEEVSARLSSVLEVVYLIFNEGYTAASRRGVAASPALQ